MKDRQREYETVYLLRPDMNDEEVNETRERIEEAVEEAGGHNLRFDDWGRRELAYEVQDEDEGRYFEQARYQYFRYLVPPESATVVEDQLRFVEGTLKDLTLKVDDDLIAEERIEQPTEIQGETLPYSE